MIHTLVVSQFSKMLGNLLAILNEAEKYAGEKKFDVAVLLQARLVGRAVVHQQRRAGAQRHAAGQRLEPQLHRSHLAVLAGHLDDAQPALGRAHHAAQ